MLLIAALALSLLAGCAATEKKEDSISVYLWSNNLYTAYAPYIQAQLPDVNIEFVVGNNDLDFYKFMNERGALPDIITCRRFSLHDAAALKDQLMDLSSTELAGTIYDAYLKNFTNADGTVNWLPLCGEVDGFVANKDLFDQHGIPLPTDYASFVSACQAFEQVGIRGFAADYAYDYTCMEILQGLSIPKLTSMEGMIWRSAYESPSGEPCGLDDTIWPEAFRRMEQFLKDTHSVPEDVDMAFNGNIALFREGKVAMIRSGGASVKSFKEQDDINAVFLPYFGQDGEQWLLTYPSFQVAVNKDLGKNSARRDNALKVLSVMLSEEGQNILAGGADVITYSQNVKLELNPILDNLNALIKQNHLYIRVASNDFFSASNDVVKKMIRGEIDAEQAYTEFDSLLKFTDTTQPETVLTVDKTYSNKFSKDGGNPAYSVMANSLRAMYGTEVLIAPATSFTGCVVQGDYSSKMAGYMIMPNALDAWRCEMTGAQLKAFLTTHIENKGNGYKPFNPGSLPVVSGISIEVQQVEDGYQLLRVLKDGKELEDGDALTVACLSTSAYMGQFLSNEEINFIKEEVRVRPAWTAYLEEGDITLSQPENYISVK